MGSSPPRPWAHPPGVKTPVHWARSPAWSHSSMLEHFHCLGMTAGAACHSWLNPTHELFHLDSYRVRNGAHWSLSLSLSAKNSRSWALWKTPRVGKEEPGQGAGAEGREASQEMPGCPGRPRKGSWSVAHPLESPRQCLQTWGWGSRGQEGGRNLLSPVGWASDSRVTSSSAWAALLPRTPGG